MRLRKKKNAASRFDACKDWLLTKENTADWCAHPHLALEIGSGKGGFIVRLAAENPDIRYIAVEKEVDCIVMAMEKAKAARVENLRFITVDAKELGLMLPHKRFETIYLNFSDPWPRGKNAKRRLTHRNLLRRFLPLLNEEGELRFKSDNDGLFAFTVEEWRELGMEELFLTYDLHKEDIPNIMTEYETRFSEMGVPIKSMWARPTDTTCEKLREYTEQKDVFPYHQLILDVAVLPERARDKELWRALDNAEIRMAQSPRSKIDCPYVRETGEDFAALAESLGEDIAHTALLSDNAETLKAAKEMGFYTLSLSKDIAADECWFPLDKDCLKKKQ